ncbi:hypothetical protein V3G70_28440, partial [Escherichia coli]|uniref:hypothetical protein n=1 Tax=Escherichia coli TaxID=562 RepID=UPI003593D1AA
MKAEFHADFLLFRVAVAFVTLFLPAFFVTVFVVAVFAVLLFSALFSPPSLLVSFFTARDSVAISRFTP